MKIFMTHSTRDQEFVESVSSHFQNEGHSVFMPTKILAGGNILSEISAAIRSADVLVAVVTTDNPNIFYELGLAAGASVPILIVARPGEHIPSDLASVPYVQLTGDSLRDAQTIVSRAEELGGSAPARSRIFKSADATLRTASRDPAFLESLSPTDFERLVVELFKERGYEVAATSHTHDIGADIILTSKKNKDNVLVELKKLSRQSRVSVESVRNLLGVVSNFGAAAGVLISTSGFTASALALAAHTSIILRTLDEVLAARSEEELLGRALNFSKSEAEARAILTEMKENGIAPDVVSYNMLLNFAKSEGEARAILKEMADDGVTPDTASYSILLNFVKSEAEARSILKKMADNGVTPNSETYSVLLNFVKSEAEARSILAEMMGNGVAPDAISYNTLLNFVKSEAEARSILVEMMENDIAPNVVSYNMLLNFAKSDAEARSILREMMENGIAPDVVSYNMLLRFAKSEAEARAIYSASSS